MDEYKLKGVSGTGLGDREQELEKQRTPMTILFSDIKDSTSFAEKKGDVEYMAMIDRHNRLLFPIIKANGGQVVKTIGDSILARFDDPAEAVKAAAGMQRALSDDCRGRDEIDQIRIRIGIHYGLGLAKDNDVFGDVVNAASRVEHQAEAGQILITDAMLKGAMAAGFICVKVGPAELRGKDEVIDLYAVGWSDRATQQLVDRLEAKYQAAQDQWRAERRSFTAKIDELDQEATEAVESARKSISEDRLSDLQFQIQQLTRLCEQREGDLASAQERFRNERAALVAQIEELQQKAVEEMARLNNPARTALAFQEQIDARVADAKKEWEIQSQRERKRLVAEIERLEKAASRSIADDKKEAARRTLLEKLGKLPVGSTKTTTKTSEQWEREFQEAKMNWDVERNELQLEIRKIELDLQRAQKTSKEEIQTELRAEYEHQLAEARGRRQRLEQDVQFLTSELASERQRLNARIEALEEELPKAQEAARRRAVAELQSQLDSKIDELKRLRSSMERQQAVAADLESDRRRMKKEIAILEERLDRRKSI